MIHTFASHNDAEILLITPPPIIERMAAYIEEEMRKHPGKSVRAVMLTCAPGGVSQGILTQCAGFTDPAENGFTLCVIVGPPKEVSECVNKFVLNAGAAFVDGVVFRN